MELRAGYKQSEVGVIPEDWEVREFLSVVSIANGQVDPKKEPFKFMILVAPDHIESKSGKLLFKITASDQRAISGKYVFKSGDVIYSKIRPYLQKATLANFEGLCSADMYPLKPNVDVLGEFILPILLSHRFTKYAESVSVRSGMPKINRTELADFVLPLPPLLEQRAIATALSDVDALLDSLEQLIAKKRDLKLAAMQQLLTGQQRLEGFSGAWEVKRLGNVARIQRGASPRPIDDPIWFDETSAIGWVRISDVTKSGIYLDKTLQKLSSIGINHSRFVPKKSLIMSICATVGRPVITDIDVCIHDGFVVFDQLEENKLFVYYFLKYIESDWFKYGQTGSQMNLNTELINGTKIGLPSLLEQQAIATILSDMDAEIAALETRCDKTTALKHGMMQELLTGKTRLV